MDFKQIQELIRLVSETNLGEVSIEQKDFKISIKNREEHITQVMATMPQAAAAYQPAALPQAPAQQDIAAPAASGAAAPAETASNLLTIKSPMIGTFYRRPSPDKSNFVEVGDEVSTGKVVCIIEAMKLFNEIESEISGKIVKILVEDSSPVEYDQPLFLVEPA
ncbi:acetyl-CoA carboxylase biotin carboxyl carrier protein [Pseudocnuella soli]|uniref:acetyl-CoA carboxylase biotin carboxyl carrier protein n=1 Tax=Pseudocnuella soli TaxID=2502779 RepID=UPI00104CB482|nr:acetyl-CoA carboxylase biotin carboxyl carrier protein [Pseudocnuella soli]